MYVHMFEMAWKLWMAKRCGQLVFIFTLQAQVSVLIFLIRKVHEAMTICGEDGNMMLTMDGIGCVHLPFWYVHGPSKYSTLSKVQYVQYVN